MLPPLCGLRESEGCCAASTNEGAVARQERCSGARSLQEMAAAGNGRCRKWPATTSKLNDNTCDTLSPQNFTTPAQIKVLVAQRRPMRLLF